MTLARIRDAVAADAPAICAIYNDLVAGSTATYRSTPATPDERAAWMTDRQAAGFPVLVAEDAGGRVLGYATYGPYRAGDGYSLTVEHSIYLAPEARGAGLGAQLMAPLIARARAAGLHAMVGALTAENEASRRFHAALGFVAEGVQRQVGHKFGRWLDLEIWVLRLDDRAAP